MSDEWQWDRLLRYVWAVAGPLAVAGSQFVLSILLLHAVNAHEFGAFSFVLVVSQLLLGVSGALLGAPFAVFAVRQGELLRHNEAGFFVMNGLISVVGGMLVGLTTMALVGDWRAAVLFGGHSVAMLFRWFGRAVAILDGRRRVAIWSDVALGTTLLALTALFYGAGQLTLVNACMALCVAAIVGVLPLGLAFLRRHFWRPDARSLHPYAQALREHGFWATIGVVTSEATANAHAYAVTTLAGAAALAPIAAGSLLIRPVSMATNAITEFERPTVARELHAGRMNLVLSSMAWFLGALLAVWGMCLLGGVALLLVAPDLVFPGAWDMAMPYLTAALWLAIAFARIIRAPSSVLLQAVGEFRMLAWGSIWSGLLTCVSVVALTLLLPAAWSLCGVLAGELLLSFLTIARASKVAKANLRSAPDSPEGLSEMGQ